MFRRAILSTFLVVFLVLLAVTPLIGLSWYEHTGFNRDRLARGQESYSVAAAAWEDLAAPLDTSTAEARKKLREGTMAFIIELISAPGIGEAMRRERDRLRIALSDLAGDLAPWNAHDPKQAAAAMARVRQAMQGYEAEMERFRSDTLHAMIVSW